MTTDRPSSDGRSPIAPGGESITSTEIPAEKEELDGHTIEELSDYLDDDCTPPDPSIDDSASCRIALIDLRRLRRLSVAFLDDAVDDRPGQEEAWIPGILSRIGLSARAGHDLPLTPPSDSGALVMTEGALRSLVRATGDAFPGFLVGRVELVGELTSADALLSLQVDVDILHGLPIREATEGLRLAVIAALRAHTLFRIGRVNVVVRDIHRGPAPA